MCPDQYRCFRRCEITIYLCQSFFRVSKRNIKRNVQHPPSTQLWVFFFQSQEWEKQSIWEAILKKNPPYKKNSILMIFKRFGLQTEVAALLNTTKKNKDSQLRLIITKEKGFHILCELLLLGKTTENVRGTIIFNWICEIEWMISNLDSTEFLWISQMKTFRRFPDSHL